VPGLGTLTKTTRSILSADVLVDGHAACATPCSVAFSRARLAGTPLCAAPTRYNLAVPLPKALARFNLKVTNPVLRHVATRAPWFGVVTHVGRKSGTRRTTPVNLFRHGDVYVIALTYGADSQWVRNVLAANGCEVVTRGRLVRLTGPEVVHDPAGALVPAPVRPILKALSVVDFMTLRPDIRT
jgi:deazaflavin-dependent oxidoreductase (nitroreductase family)